MKNRILRYTKTVKLKRWPDAKFQLIKEQEVKESKLLYGVFDEIVELVKGEGWDYVIIVKQGPKILERRVKGDKANDV